MSGRGRSLGRLVARVVGGLVAVLALLLVYGVLVEPRFVLDEERLDGEVVGLDDSWSGSTVAFFADLQVGMWWANTGMVDRVVDRVVEERPAAVLLGGDFVYSHDPQVPEQVQAVVRMLAPLTEAGIPTYAVLGNHDYKVEAVEELTRALEGIGIEVLRNEAARVPSPGGGQPLYVVGLGPARPDRVDVGQALRGVPDDAPRLVVMHNPTAFPELPPGSAPLALAGHTHCGQVALPGAPRWSYLGLSQEEEVVADGFAPAEYGAEGNRLFVSCGIGFSVLPLRINAPPQVVFVDLTPA